METNTPPSPSAAAPLEGCLGRIEAVLKEMIRAGKFALEVSIAKAPADSIDPETPEWFVNFSGRDSDIVLESHAALLDALASIALKAARVDESLHRRISFDCQGYRLMRTVELRLMAQMAAERVMESGESFALTPMNAAERRTIHLALANRPRVFTESEGLGRERKVVIRPAKTKTSHE